jgi:hypothetical protein
MKRAAGLIAILLPLFLSFPAHGIDVAGVTLAETAPVGGKTLALVGAGVRTKTFLKIKVYIGGLYMENPSKDAAEVIASDQAKRMVMHDKNSKGSLPALKERIDQFNSYFDGSVKKGEEVVLTYLPGSGTEVVIKGETKGTVPGKDFMEALFKIWFGQFPADRGLKESILK